VRSEIGRACHAEPASASHRHARNPFGLAKSPVGAKQAIYSRNCLRNPPQLFSEFRDDQAPPLQPRAALALAVAQGGMETRRLSDSTKGDLLSAVYSISPFVSSLPRPEASAVAQRRLRQKVEKKSSKSQRKKQSSRSTQRFLNK